MESTPPRKLPPPFSLPHSRDRARAARTSRARASSIATAARLAARAAGIFEIPPVSVAHVGERGMRGYKRARSTGAAPNRVFREPEEAFPGLCRLVYLGFPMERTDDKELERKALRMRLDAAMMARLRGRVGRDARVARAAHSLMYFNQDSKQFCISSPSNTHTHTKFTQITKVVHNYPPPSCPLSARPA